MLKRPIMKQNRADKLSYIFILEALFNFDRQNPPSAPKRLDFGKFVKQALEMRQHKQHEQLTHNVKYPHDMVCMFIRSTTCIST